MAQQLRNTVTGVVVEVRDDKVLDGYEPVEKKSVPTKGATKSGDKSE
jgi:hypothetical protein